MKIILLKDVPKVGRKYDVKDVADGFAQNMLIPRKLAEIATSSGLKRIETLKLQDAAEKKVQGELLLKNLEVLKKLNITVKGKANDKGSLFAGITKEILVKEIHKEANINIDPESIVLPKPLKEIGEHKIALHVLDKKAEFTVTIEAE